MRFVWSLLGGGSVLARDTVGRPSHAPRQWVGWSRARRAR